MWFSKKEKKRPYWRCEKHGSLKSVLRFRYRGDESKPFCPKCWIEWHNENLPDLIENDEK